MITKNFSKFKRTSAIVASAVTVALMSISPTLAKDPFRSSNPRQIGDQTEAVFKVLFEKGNYPEAKRLLKPAELANPKEPLVYAMRASLAYSERDATAFKTYADKTVQIAQQMLKTDPLRGNIYLGVGNFLQGGYVLQNQGALAAMNKLKLVFQYFDEAKKIAPQDPELNLIKGYMDFILAVNLPFADINGAINQLEKYATPKYLAYRGMAIGYRDKQQYDKALKYVNLAFAQTPNNPELYYLKAQIYFRMGEKSKSLSHFDESRKNFNEVLKRRNLLPNTIVAQIVYEQCQSQNPNNKFNACASLAPKK